MCGLKISIHDVTYQEPLDHWCKRILRYIRNHANSLQRGSVEKLNAENIFSRYSDVVLTHRESIHPHVKDAENWQYVWLSQKIYQVFQSGNMC